MSQFFLTTAWLAWMALAPPVLGQAATKPAPQDATTRGQVLLGLVVAANSVISLVQFWLRSRELVRQRQWEREDRERIAREQKEEQKKVAHSLAAVSRRQAKKVARVAKASAARLEEHVSVNTQLTAAAGEAAATAGMAAARAAGDPELEERIQKQLAGILCLKREAPGNANAGRTDAAGGVQQDSGGNGGGRGGVLPRPPEPSGGPAQ